MAENTNEIKVYALGGLCEVGKNCYGIEYKDQIFLIDCGILFPDSVLPGVDYVIPDFTYLIKNQKRIVGLFITHGHEDHIGGIPYLAKLIKIPKIYAAGIAIDLITSKFEDFANIEIPEIIEYNQDSEFFFDEIFVSFIRLNHSIPDSYSIVVHTPYGPIIHTGDFKVDFTPTGRIAEYDKLSALGASGVLLLLADSTNAMLEGYSSSEHVVSESIRDLFSHIEDRIIIATFASNLYRIDQIIQASILNDRKIAVFGRSMQKTIDIGIKNGYIKANIKNFVSQDDIENIPDKNLTILCTGSQGEPMAALSRIANNSHKSIFLKKSDTIIFSSSPIPGNQEGVNNTINKLFRAGANVIVNSPLNDTHTSGHANQGELKMIHALTKEKYFMPIHGEYRMLKTHAKLAQTCGVKKENCFVMNNGNVLHIFDNRAFVKGSIESGETYIDGSLIGSYSQDIVYERKQLSTDGMFTFIVTINRDNNYIYENIQVVSRGFIYMKENEDFTKNLINILLEKTKNEFDKRKNNLKKLETILEQYIYNYLEKNYARTPLIIVKFMEV